MFHIGWEFSHSFTHAVHEPAKGVPSPVPLKAPPVGTSLTALQNHEISGKGVQRLSQRHVFNGLLSFCLFRENPPKASILQSCQVRTRSKLIVLILVASTTWLSANAPSTGWLLRADLGVLRNASTKTRLTLSLAK